MAMEMHLQDRIEGTRSNNSGSASNCHSNGGTQSENVVQLWDISPVGNNHTSKVRKPYTITKQREKWTDEEHKKFLEALKLYGRHWRQIEEHIGTKTAVQIRSHAQKFFSKAVRESDGSTESSIKPIDIPPPRPKRKPLHPYPRKSVDSFKGPSIPNEPERSPFPNLLVTEKETQSPISVLSAFGSEAFGSAFSEKTNRCLLPNSCTTDIHSASLSPVENENDCMASNSSEEEEKESLASVPLSTNSNPRLSMKSELSSTETECFKEESTNVPHPRVTSIKLLGRTVSMIGNGKCLNVDEDNIEFIICNSDKAVVSENEKRGQRWPFNQLGTQLSLGMCDSNWSITADGVKVKSTEYPKENLCFGESATDVSLPWWNLCHGLAVFWPCNQILNPTPLRPSLKQNSRENESSCTGSNAESVSDTENREKSSDAVDSQCQPSHHGEGIAHQKSARGFVPYKRCLAERDGNSLIVALEEREGQRARVCL